MSNESSRSLRRKIAHSREQRLARGQAVATAIEATLAHLPLPAGHQVCFDRKHQLSWYLGGPGSSVSWSARRSPSERPLVSPLDAEVRVFLDEPRCVVWLEQERPEGRVSLLGRTAVWLYAKTYEQLLAQAMQVLMAPLQGLMAPASLRRAS